MFSKSLGSPVVSHDWAACLLLVAAATKERFPARSLDVSSIKGSIYREANPNTNPLFRGFVIN